MTTSEQFGYSRSQRFIEPGQFDRLPPNELVFALRLAVNACNDMKADVGSVRFDGAYVLQEKKHAPAVPVVYLISADSESAARQIHKFVWNQNQTPFLIVESPQTIRLYSGFAFDRDQDAPLETVLRESAEQLQRLAAFRSESIDDGTIWKQWAHAVDPKQRVDEKLLADLRKLDQRLQGKEGMSRAASHGLIGKYVYLNYLRARDILSDKKLAKWEIDADHLFTKQATLKAFRRVNDELQDWLNGSVFSLGEDALSEITAEQLKLVARVFAGDSPVNLNEIQTSLFGEYDFAHIPIETLSCVYEQFLHDAKAEDDQPSRGKTLGAYYTPLPLADYVLSEMEHRRPLKPGMTVLDPACGSGAFLVQCYRRLIEKQRRSEQRDLKASELRDLLTKHIFGIDRDDDACRVAELSLIMTLLDYIEPPDLETTNFKLPSLRGQNIFQGDFFDSEGPVFDLLSQQRFDWIVGNPPWAEVKGTPSADHEHFTAFEWMKSHKKTHPTSGNQLAEAFIWKAGEHLANDGACGLVVLAMTWFKKEATLFRQRFFAARRVWCLANFANLAEVLFAARSRRSASVIFFEPQAPESDHCVLSFAPFVAEQIANRPERSSRRLTTWNIIVTGDELREVDQAAAACGDSLTWKLAMWGSSRDRKLLSRTAANSPCLETVAQDHGLVVHQGLALRSSRDAANEAIEKHDVLVGRCRIKMPALRRVERLFSLPELALETISADQCFVRKGRSRNQLAIANPPHIFVDEALRFAIFLDEFVAIPHPQIGIAGDRRHEGFLKALSIYLSSDFARYHQFFVSTKWGVDASLIDLISLKMLPVPIGRLTPSELDEWSAFHTSLREASSAVLSLKSDRNCGVFRRLISQLNNKVFHLLGLRTVDRWLIEDFVELNMAAVQGAIPPDLNRLASNQEQSLYLNSLRECLDGFFASDRGLRHKLEVLADGESALMAVSLVRAKQAVEPVIVLADDPASRDLKIIRDQLRKKHSQWVYFDRNLKVYDPKRGVLYQFKPLQRLHWTRRQAVLDADDIIAETLSEGGVS